MYLERAEVLSIFVRDGILDGRYNLRIICGEQMKSRKIKILIILVKRKEDPK